MKNYPRTQLLTRDSVGVSVMCTYLYNLYKGVPPPRGGGVKNALQIMSLAAYASETNELGLHKRTRGSV